MSLPESITLAGRTAIVTGGSRGIGRAISLELARRGARIAVIYANADKAAQNTVEEINALGSEAICIKADVKDHGSSQRIVSETLKQLSTDRIDILVHNAAFADGKSTSDVTLESFNSIMETNVNGPFFLTQAALPHIPSGGRIILISSTSARLAVKGFDTPVYAASKAALESLARSWAYEFGPKGITVNAVAPGLTETDLINSVPQETMKVVRDNYEKITPFGRPGLPDDVAQVVAFLASEGARWVTGSTVSASGGRIVY